MTPPLTIKFAAYSGAVPPRRTRMSVGGWAGADQPMADGSEPQPWHCLPFVTGSTYGLELVYPYQTECTVVRDGDTIRFDWDFAKEPGGILTGGEFVAFAPRARSRFYMLNTRLDVQPPPGHVIRTAPHPRFFTDDTGTVPAAIIGHLENEWFPRRLFIVFRAPLPGERHVFRFGEPYAQILAVPARATYELVPMTPEEEAKRRKAESDLDRAKAQVADNVWHNPENTPFGNHYKVLSRAFAEGGQSAVDAAIRAGVEKLEANLPADLAEALALGDRALAANRYDAARDAYSRVLSRAPNHHLALSNLGICAAAVGQVASGLQLMIRATEIAPRSLTCRANLAELYRLLRRWPEAEAAFRAALALSPDNPGLRSLLGLVLAELGRLNEAIDACRAAAATGPAIPTVHVRLGAVLARAGRTADARAALETALALDPVNADAQRALAQLPTR